MDGASDDPAYLDMHCARESLVVKGGPQATWHPLPYAINASPARWGALEDGPYQPELGLGSLP